MISAISWLTFSTILYGACQWATVAVLARSGTPYDVGIFTHGQAFTTPLLTLAGLGLGPFLATDVNNRHPIANCFSTLFITLTVAYLSLTAVALHSFGLGPKSEVVAAVGIAKAFDAVSFSAYGVFTRYDQQRLTALSRTIQGLFQFFTLWVTFAFTQSVVLASVALAIVSVIVTIVWDLRLVSGLSGVHPLDWLTKISDFKGNRAIITLTWSLAIGGAVDMLVLAVPRLSVEHILGVKELGIFSALWTLLLPFSIIPMVVNSALSSRLARISTNRRRFIFVSFLLILQSTAFGALALMCSTLFGKKLLYVAYGPTYANHYHVLVILMAAAIPWFASGAMTTAANAIQFFAARLWANIAAAIAGSITCLLICPSMGMSGAAYGYFASTVTMAVVLGSLLIKTVRSMG